jgi:hypothetical protein
MYDWGLSGVISVQRYFMGWQGASVAEDAATRVG